MARFPFLVGAVTWAALLAVPSMASTAGAPVPGATPEARENHWSFQPVRRPEIPSVRTRSWVRQPVDAFVAARLEAAGIEPGPESDRVALLRRVTWDLTGLPPTPVEVDAFLADASETAYERVVDRLLDSPRYGERWGRHWLDLARYAESEGFKADETRPNAWRYRDYVIDAFNADKPYDRFVQEQIAGDELWPDDLAARVATGFQRHYPDESNARNLVQRRQEILNDITDTVGFAFVGLTYACARCHDHKTDPIPQADYYRLQAFFANTAAADDLVLVDRGTRERHEAQLRLWEEATREIREELECLEVPEREAIVLDYVEKYPDDIQAMLSKADADRSPFERQMVAKAKLYIDPASHQYIAGPGAVGGRLRGAAKARWTELRDALKRATPAHPGPLPVGTGMVDLGPESPETRMLRRGNWNDPGAPVEPGFLSVAKLAPPVVATVANRSSGRRAALARILTDPANPLVARVFVNRVWHHHFGRGLVGTPSDFGIGGERPSHPELLDWLASDFVEHGWRVKRLHRQLVTSATYRQSAAHRPDAARVEEANRLLWKFPRRRLEAEAIRDGMLAASGRLNPAMGGPGIFPELPEGMQTRGGWKVTEDAGERDRRSVYVFVRRNTRYPMLEAFDSPDTHESCACRNTTTSPVQALTLLNNTLTLDWARSLAGRSLEEAGGSWERALAQVWRRAYSRPPRPEERAMAQEFLARRGALERTRADGSEVSAPIAGAPGPASEALVEGMTDLCHVLLNSNEFVYVH